MRSLLMSPLIHEYEEEMISKYPLYNYFYSKTIENRLILLDYSFFRSQAIQGFDDYICSLMRFFWLITISIESDSFILFIIQKAIF